MTLYRSKDTIPDMPGLGLKDWIERQGSEKPGVPLMVMEEEIKR